MRVFVCVCVHRPMCVHSYIARPTIHEVKLWVRDDHVEIRYELWFRAPLLAEIRGQQCRAGDFCVYGKGVSKYS